MYFLLSNEKKVQEELCFFSLSFSLREMSKGQVEKKKEGCVILFPVIKDIWLEKDKQLKEKVTLSLFSFPYSRVMQEKRYSDPSKNFWQNDIEKNNLLYVSYASIRKKEREKSVIRLIILFK